MRWLRDDGEETTGAKRNRLLALAETPYVAFVDDDDLVAPDYCARILEALYESPDVVGFKLDVSDDDVRVGTWVHSFTQYRDPRAIRHRTPTHLNPTRTDIALSVGFRELNCGEDVDYADRLALLPTLKETFIDHVLYQYLRRSDRRWERANLNP